MKRIIYEKPITSAEGGIMKILGFARRLKDIRAVVQELRDHGIEITGPYRRSDGTFIYSLADCVVTERELLELVKAGKLDATKISKNGAV